MGATGHVPELGPNKFQDRPCGTSRMQKNLFATGAPPRAPLDELTAFPQTLYLAGKGLAAISPKTSPPLSAFWASDFGPSALAADAK